MDRKRHRFLSAPVRLISRRWIPVILSLGMAPSLAQATAPSCGYIWLTHEESLVAMIDELISFQDEVSQIPSAKDQSFAHQDVKKKVHDLSLIAGDRLPDLYRERLASRKKAIEERKRQQEEERRRQEEIRREAQREIEEITRFTRMRAHPDIEMKMHRSVFLPGKKLAVLTNYPLQPRGFRIYDLNTQKIIEVATPKWMTTDPYAIMADSKGDFVIVATYDRIGRWSAKTKKWKWAKYSKPHSQNAEIRLSRDGRKVFIVHHDSSIEILGIPSFEVIVRATRDFGSAEWPRISESADGRYVFVASYRWEPFLYDLKERKQLDPTPFEGRLLNVNDAIFTKNSEEILVSSTDGSIRSYSLRTQQLSRTPFSAEGPWIETSADGRFLSVMRENRREIKDSPFSLIDLEMGRDLTPTLMASGLLKEYDGVRFSKDGKFFLIQTKEKDRAANVESEKLHLMNLETGRIHEINLPRDWGAYAHTVIEDGGRTIYMQSYHDGFLEIY